MCVAEVFHVNEAPLTGTQGYQHGELLQSLRYGAMLETAPPSDRRAGYGRFGGTRTSASELQQILQIMEENQRPDPSRLLTGEFIPR